MTTIDKVALMEQAKEVLKNAYCPYSKFPVGAAVLYKDGRVITGANIENVSFGVTNCAERSAIFYGASQGYRKGDILAIAVAGETEGFLPPCNICRQVMVEFCGPDTLVFLSNGKGEILELRLEELVPYSFVSLEM